MVNYKQEDDDLAKILELSPIPLDEEDENEYQLPATLDSNMETDDDYEYVRRNLYELIEITAQSIRDLAKLAKASQAPRMFEVYAQMVKANIDANDKLFLLKKTRDELSPQQREEITNVHNNLIVTSSELLTVIEEAREKSKIAQETENKNVD